MRFATFHDIRVEDVSIGSHNLPSRKFTIHCTRDTWDMKMHASVPKIVTYQGFRNLPPEVLEYLIVAKPHAIPTEIRALDPDDLWQAFNIYFAGVNRGYFKGAATS